MNADAFCTSTEEKWDVGLELTTHTVSFFFKHMYSSWLNPHGFKKLLYSNLWSSL